MKKMIQLYGPESDNEIVTTAQGKVKFIDFLRAEEKRIKSNPNRVVNLISRLGFSWMEVDDITISQKAQACGVSWRKYMPRGQKQATN